MIEPAVAVVRVKERLIPVLKRAENQVAEMKQTRDAIDKAKNTIHQAGVQVMTQIQQYYGKKRLD